MILDKYSEIIVFEVVNKTRKYLFFFKMSNVLLGMVDVVFLLENYKWK